MGRVRLPFPKKEHLKRLSVVFFLVLLMLIALSTYFLKYKNKVFPNVNINSVNIGGLTFSQAKDLLSDKSKIPEKIKIIGPNQAYTLNTKDIEVDYNFEESVLRAYNIGRSGNIFNDIETRLKLLKNPKSLGLALKLNEEKLAKTVSIIAGQNSIDPISPSVSLVNGVVKVQKGLPGNEVDQNKLRAIIGRSISFGQSDEILVPITVVDKSLTEDEATKLQKRGEAFVGRSIEAKLSETTYEIKDGEIIKTIEPKGGFNTDSLISISEKVAAQIERPAQNPKFNFENGKVTEFLPALEGVKLRREDFLGLLNKTLTALEAATDKKALIEIPVDKTQPAVTTDKVNNLGIKELLSKATTTYYHSIPSRVHNVDLAASRINGTLVAPGETFSFNKTLGDVSQFTGYQQAYIISGGKTILGDGGGVCQVSTTLFRSLLNAGMPINERSPHAYRVGYYEQNSPPGFDATVYGPAPDLKFTNDTGNHILIKAVSDPKHYSLTFELYGTKDQRLVEIGKPFISNVSPAPEDRYQDDPTLPAGTIKQIDFKAPGAKVSFAYSVKKDGVEIFNKTFVSNYRPWQAVYLRGTGPAR